MAPAESRTKERMLGAQVCQAPCKRREDSVRLAVRERGAVRENQLHMLPQFALADEALMAGQGMCGTGDGHHRHIDDLLRLHRIWHRGHGADDAQAASALQHWLD